MDLAGAVAIVGRETQGVDERRKRRQRELIGRTKPTLRRPASTCGLALRSVMR